MSDIKFGGNIDGNGTQWNTNNTVIYINKLYIRPNTSVEYYPSVWQRIKSTLGLGPTRMEIEAVLRKKILDEETLKPLIRLEKCLLRHGVEEVEK